MAKVMDGQVIMTTTMGVVEQTFAQMSGVVRTADPETKEDNIVEYYGRMRAQSMVDFNSALYIAFVNFYVTEADVARQKPKGALILYVDAENASKLYKALNFPIPDDEDDASMLDACGELCNLIGGGLKNELANLGFVNLIISPPQVFKNTITQGVPFSLDQKKKYVFSFFYWKRKALVVELTMAALPEK